MYSLGSHTVHTHTETHSVLYWARNQCERNAEPLSKLFDGGGAQTLNHKN